MRFSQTRPSMASSDQPLLCFVHNAAFPACRADAGGLFCRGQQPLGRCDWHGRPGCLSPRVPGLFCETRHAPIGTAAP
jgi:hypothetical protein